MGSWDSVKGAFTLVAETLLLINQLSVSVTVYAD